SMARTPSRTARWSSAMRTRITADPLRMAWLKVSIGAGSGPSDDKGRTARGKVDGVRLRRLRYSCARLHSVVCTSDRVRRDPSETDTNSELGWTNHRNEPSDYAAQGRVQGHETTAEKKRERDVLSVVCFRPAKFVRQAPCFASEPRMRSRPDRRPFETRHRLARDIRIEIPAPHPLMERRAHL